MFIITKMMPTQYIADAEKDASMKNISPKEAIEVLKDMKIETPLPKAAVTQRKRNAAIETAISALSCSEIPNSSDLISRQVAIDKAIMIPVARIVTEDKVLWRKAVFVEDIEALPSAQPNLSKAYSKAVFTWLMNYQIRAAELKGRYTPYEVLSWVINDWRKENG